MFYELAASSWDDKELAAIQGVIDSDRFTMGPEVAVFEEEFAAYHDKKYGYKKPKSHSIQFHH